ncbi:M23 family metallopeptidase [Romeria aff. gracilis LEGE 07310]|uniref:M23 family metallopeptidase n=1 Tax=Vasconcelosia minhoensis LEGE 07310 TaxID=915328 RepID=A0A8J7AKF5_9CYAN|nr:M23 family metallopeptidase [Romeria gracilis]MBE9075706.1 M23 family metallopeptidase [Romeria aff. gracilis LEGE 07310]
MDSSILITQGLIPFSLLLWQAYSRSQSLLGWLLKTLMVAGYLGAVTLIGLWAVLLPWWTPYFYWAVWGVLAILTLLDARRQSRWPKRNAWILSRVFGCGLLTGLFWAVTLQAALGYRLPAAAPISLTFPLKNGTYYVANGGSNLLVNAHLETLAAAKARDYRGQSYGIDLTKLNPFGVRSPGILPKDLINYEIYGQAVYAPCGGSVIATANDLPDLIPPQADSVHREGNHVLLRCETADVLLAHLQQSSVKVAPGQPVTVGQPLGNVGNSGSTSEPHLHIHAQRPGSAAAPLDGDPLPILFGDRYLVRNARMTA